MTSLQYNWKYRKYRSIKGESDNFDDVVPSRAKVTITQDLYYPHTSMRTPFEGVQIAPYRDHPELAEYLRRLIHAKRRPFAIWTELKKAIFEGWRTDKIHVIGASSGYDSRIIAKVLQELRKKHGSSWFGETYFVECGGEAVGFKQIMQALGFSSKNYVIWEPNYDYGYFMDISKRFNGLCAYPVNQWYDYYASQFNLNDIQYISGYGGNISDAMRENAPFLKPVKDGLSIKKRLRLFFKWNYDYQLAAFKQPPHSFHPFWSWRYITAVAGFDFKENITFKEKTTSLECSKKPLCICVSILLRSAGVSAERLFWVM